MSNEQADGASLKALIAMQQRFDTERNTTFSWASPITENDVRPLLHNVLSLAGEVGEVANLVKKFDRGDFEFESLIRELPSELADVAIYLFKLAYQSGIDLEMAILEKMKVNENRFPKSVDENEKPSTHSLVSTAQDLAALLEEREVAALRRLYTLAEVVPPARTSEVVLGALLATEVAKLADAEGDHIGQELRWKELQPAAASAGMTYSDLVQLARHDQTIAATVEPLLSSVSASTA
ncbi:hypothetical protein [Diaminobutyricibacter sp. McL0608]|uniref:hypothetical protein n=1 Tax=Leifsonia sp. McL0608 TaxID=3143537 RepID=UPI0031F2F129